MAIGTDDNLDVGIGIVGVEDFEADIARLTKAARQAEKNIQNAFTGNSKVDKDINDLLLNIQRKVLAVSRAYTQLGKAGAEGFGDITERQTKALVKLTELQAKLRELDKLALGKPSQAKLADIGKEADKVINQIKLLERELVDLQQKDIVLKAKIVPEEQKPVVKPYRDDRDLHALLKKQQAAALDLERQLVRLGRLEGKSFEGISRQAIHGQKQIKTLADRVVQLQRVMNITDDKTIITQMLREARLLDNELDEVRRSLVALRRQELHIPRGGTDGGKKPVGYGLLAGLGIPGLGGALGVAGGAYAIGYGIHKFIDLGNKAVERAVEMTRANRLLASSAAEAGIAYDGLAKKNREFARDVGLSEVKATTTIAKIVQLSTRTQQPERLDELIKGFKDLGAARGLNATELETIIQQIITGQDEGYKKLLLPNPSQLYEQFAERTGRTVGSLSAVERTRIAQDELIKRAEVFAGSAEARMASLEGRVATTRAEFENLANTLSQSIAGSYDMANFLGFLTNTFKGLNYEIDSLAEKVERGINIDDLIKTKGAEPSVGGVATTTLSGFYKFMSGFSRILSTLETGATLGSTSYFADSPQNFADTAIELSPDVQAERKEDFIRQQVNAELKVRADLEKTANERRIVLARSNAEEEYNNRKSAFEKKFSEDLGKGRKTEQDLQELLDRLDSATKEGGSTLDFSDFEARVQAEVAALDLTKFPGKSIEELEAKIRKQLTDEMNAALKESNKPILDEEAKQNFIAKWKEEASRMRQEAFASRLADPKLRIGELLNIRADLLGDDRVFPEIKEKLLNQITELQESMAVKARDAARNVRDELASITGKLDDNPFIQLIINSETAMEKAVERFTGQFGPAIANMMGQIAKAEADAQLAQARYRSSDTALKFGQEARKLGLTPDTQTNAFQRRLETLETRVRFIISDRELRKIAEEDKFYAERYKEGGRTFLEDKYGYGGLAKLQLKAGGVDLAIRITEALEDIQKFRALESSETGLYGKEAISKALLDRLPSRDELLFRFNASYGEDREEARRLLQARSEASEVLVKANEKKLVDYIANQQFLDQTVLDAEERLKNLGQFTGGLSDKQKLDEYLAITGEIGTGELTPALRQGRIRALLEKQRQEQEQFKIAEDRAKTIDGVLSTIKKQLESEGLAVTLKDIPIVDVSINAAGVVAEVVNRPNAASTRARSNN